MPSPDVAARAAVDASVVIPAHDREDVVGRAVASVLSQEGASLEVIVVDDGSADRTADAARDAARGDPRVKVIARGARGGAQAARNAGIRAAAGRWVAFLDSDDEWLPGSLAGRLAVARDDGVEVVHSECLVSRRPGEPPAPFGIPPLSGAVYGDVLKAPGPMFQSLLVGRAALERIGALDEGLVAYQEWDTAIRLARHFRFGFLARPTFVYHAHRGDAISRDALRAARGYEQVVSRHLREIVSELGRGDLASHYEAAARLYGDAGDRDGMARCLRAAIRARPWGASALRRIRALRGGVT